MSKSILFSLILLLLSPNLFARGGGGCCSSMGGIKWCDSSAGRFICHNGEFSACYCTRHAIMDLQLIKGCCLWQGGPLKRDTLGMVVCNDGSISEVCTLQDPKGKYAAW